jgi:hypothetical protein
VRLPTRSLAALAVAALVILGGAWAWRALRPGPSDEERIRALFLDAARAAGERRVNDVVAAVSERFRGQGLDRAGLKQLVAYHALRGSWNAVVPLDVAVEVSGDRAEASADVALARGAAGEGVVGRLPEEGSAWRIEASLEREAQGWRVVSARWRRLSLADGR